MSEETPSAKKAARKSVRKKTAKKSAAKKPASSESEEQLPLSESAAPSEPAVQEEKRPSDGRNREPKSGVRDARRERPSDSDSAPEVVKKLVPDNAQKESRNEQKESRDQPRNDQDQFENGDRRLRNRGRNRGRNERNDRNEKREEAPRSSISAKHLKKKAWKIFESEVTEEGLALLDDNGLREYARSSFNAARIFLEEAGRVGARQEDKKPKQQKSDSDKKSDDRD